MTCIVLIEDEHSLRSAQNGIRATAPIFVAATAKAVFALEQAGLEYIPAFSFCNPANLSTMVPLLFSRVKDVLQTTEKAHENYADALLGNVYFIFHEFMATVGRAYLLAQAITATGPDEVHIISSPKQTASRPIESAYEKVCDAFGARLVKWESNNRAETHNKSILLRGLQRNIQILRTMLGRWRRLADNQLTAKDNPGGNLLYVGGINSDWLQFKAYTKRFTPQLAHHWIHTQSLDGAPWNNYFDKLMSDSCLKTSIKFGCPKEPIDNLSDFSEICCSFTIEFSGIKIDFGYELSTVIMEVSRYARQIRDHSIDVAKRIAEQSSPNAICFSALTSVNSRVLSTELRRLGFPTIYYQNGGIYGVHENPPLEEMAESQTDYFFAYGKGIHPNPNSARTSTAEFVPTGSMRLFDLTLVRRFFGSNPKRAKLKVVWISEGTSLNTNSLWFQVEDTLRFDLQKKGLTLLASSNKLEVIYRPIPSQAANLVTPSWIQKALPQVSVDDYSESRYLIRDADIVVCDVHCNTSWDEALVLGKPLIVYLDEEVTRLRPGYADVCEQSFVWRRKPADFLGELGKLAETPSKYLATYDKDPTSYLNLYANPNPGAIDAILSIINQPHAGMPIVSISST